MNPELESWSRARPIRVAFLVQEGEHDAIMLDGIFADCYYRWGGRFSLIVPCVGGRIAPAYWPWLETYDPDVVYSYVALSREDILEIHERLNPSLYKLHELHGPNPRLDVHGFKPQYDFSPLCSLSAIFRLARYGGRHTADGTLKIIDSWHTERESRLLADNLGTYLRSNGGSIFPNDARQAAVLQTVVSPDHFNDRRYGVPPDLDRVPDELAAFQSFASKQASSLSVISSLFARKLDYRTRWSGAFNLVVGETFSDRLLFWNARLLIPSWLDNDLCCFRVTMETLRDDAYRAMIGDLLKYRNHVNAGSGGQSQIVISSTSATAEELEEAKALVASTKPWSGLETKLVGSLDEIVPENNDLKNARAMSGFGFGVPQTSDWTRQAWNPDTISPPAVRPDHLADVPPRQSFAEGFWATDFDIENETARPRFTNNNRWDLPRRWRLAGAFGVKFASARQNVLPPLPRRSRNGHLAVFVNEFAPLETITVPTSLDAIYHALTRDGAHAQDEPKRGRVSPPQKVAIAQPSNEARYLTGVLGLAGGLENASAYFLHPFLAGIFAEMGGTPSLPKDKIEPTANRIAKVARTKSVFDLPEEKDALAVLVVKAAAGLKTPRLFVAYSELKEKWEAYRKTYWERNPLQHDPGSDVDWDASEAATLDRCFMDLRERQIVFQGHRWLCRECHHKNWLNIDALDTTLECEVCRTETLTPIEIKWQFRPNEFLIESLRDHSTLSLIWVLDILRQRSRSAFYYAGPTEFRLTYEAKSSDAEADLLVVADGRAYLCEVKSSWASLRRSDIRKLVDLAKRLRPDVALLAVMEDGGDLLEEIAEAQAELATDGIAWELITLRGNQFDDDPYLP